MEICNRIVRSNRYDVDCDDIHSLFLYAGEIRVSILKAENLKKYYGQEHNLVKALDGVDIEISKGEFVSIVGTSGRPFRWTTAACCDCSCPCD